VVRQGVAGYLRDREVRGGTPGDARTEQITVRGLGRGGGFLVPPSGKSGFCEKVHRNDRPGLWFNSGKSGESGFLRRTFLYTMYTHTRDS